MAIEYGTVFAFGIQSVNERTCSPGESIAVLTPLTSHFLTPTKEARRLAILLTLLRQSKISQQQIGKTTGLSSAMVNNYMKEFQHTGLVLVVGSTAYRQSYHLTAAGVRELKRLLQQYINEINAMQRILPEHLAQLGHITTQLHDAPDTGQSEIVS